MFKMSSKKLCDNMSFRHICLIRNYYITLGRPGAWKCWVDCTGWVRREYRRTNWWIVTSNDQAEDIVYKDKWRRWQRTETPGDAAWRKGYQLSPTWWL